MNKYIEINIPTNQIAASFEELGQDLLTAGDYAFVYTLKALLFSFVLIIGGLSLLFMELMLPTLWVDFWHAFVGDFWWAFVLVCISCAITGINLAVAVILEIEWLWKLIRLIQPSKSFRPQPNRSLLVIPQGTEGAVA